MERIQVQNINVPGYERSVDARKYAAMRQALDLVLPDSEPGLTQAEMFEAVIGHLPHDLFPAGEKAGWWVKTVQLDLEAKGLIVREPTRPVRWHRTRSLNG